MSFDVKSALQSGYTEQEIINHLSKEYNFDVKGALSSGYSLEEIGSGIKKKPTISKIEIPSLVQQPSEQRYLQQPPPPAKQEFYTGIKPIQPLSTGLQWTPRQIKEPELRAATPTESKQPPLLPAQEQILSKRYEQKRQAELETPSQKREKFGNALLMDWVVPTLISGGVIEYIPKTTAVAKQILKHPKIAQYTTSAITGAGVGLLKKTPQVAENLESIVKTGSLKEDWADIPKEVLQTSIAYALSSIAFDVVGMATKPLLFRKIQYTNPDQTIIPKERLKQLVAGAGKTPVESRIWNRETAEYTVPRAWVNWVKNKLIKPDLPPPGAGIKPYLYQPGELERLLKRDADITSKYYAQFKPTAEVPPTPPPPITPPAPSVQAGAIVGYNVVDGKPIFDLSKGAVIPPAVVPGVAEVVKPPVTTPEPAVSPPVPVKVGITEPTVTEKFKPAEIPLEDIISDYNATGNLAVLPSPMDKKQDVIYLNKKEYPIEDAKRIMQETIKEKEKPEKSIEVKTEPDITPSEKTRILEEIKFPIETVLIKNIKLKPSELQFKLDVSAEGVQKPLKGEWNELAAGNVLLWKSKTGNLYVANGHHRLSLAKNKNIKTINAQILKETDGYSITDARRIAAETNISEGRGTIYDHAEYFRTTPEYTPELAEQKGISGKGYSIGRFASDEIYNQFRSKKISPEAAESISITGETPSLQNAGLKYVLENPKTDPEEIKNFIKALSIIKPVKAKTKDLFGYDDTVLIIAEKMGKEASNIIKELKNRILSVQGAVKRPEIARQLGVDVKDPEGIKNKISEIKTKIDVWEKWQTNTELINQIKEKLGLETKPTEELVEIETKMFDKRYDDYYKQAIEKGATPEQAKKYALEKLVTEEKKAPSPVTGKAVQEEFKVDWQTEKGEDLFAPKKVEVPAEKPVITFEEFKKNEIARLGNRHPAVMNEKQLRERYKKFIAKPPAEVPEGKAPSGVGFAKPLEAGLEEVKKNDVYPDAPVDFQPQIEMPELYKLAKELMGNPPLAARLRTNLGLFVGAKGLPSAEIKINLEAFKNPIEANKILAHEIGHLIDWLPDYTLKRGNLIGRLKTLQSFLKNTFGAEDINNKEIKKELIELTKYWHPFDENKASANYLKYRKSARELYAEAISVLFNQPEKLKEISPTFYKLFWENLDKKPDVNEALQELYKFIGQDYAEVLKQRQSDIRDMFEKAEKRFIEIRNEEKAKDKSLWIRIKDELIDKNIVLLDKVKELKLRGIKLNPEDDPKYYMSEYNYLGGKLKNILDDVNEQVLLPSQKEGISENDIGEYLFLRRVITERKDIANPLGQNRLTAQKQFDYLMNNLKPKQKQVLEQATSNLRKIAKNLNEEANKVELYKPEIYDKIITNEEYAPFQVLDYLDEYVTPKVIHQVGTFKEIANPMTSSILKMISLKRAIERQKIRMKTVHFLKVRGETFKTNEIQEAEYKQLGKVREIREKEGFGVLPVYEKGIYKGYYIDPYIADSLNYNPAPLNNAILSTFKYLNRSWFRPLYVNLNLGFQSFNLIRDLTRAWKLNPNLKFYEIIPQYIKAYPVAKERVFGIKTSEEAHKLLREMQESGALSLTYNDILKGSDEELSQAQHLLTKYGILEKEQKKGFSKWLEKIENLGNIIETLPKVVGYKTRLRKSSPQYPIQEIAYETRAYSGSPDFLTKGRGYLWSNEIFLFSNAITQGIRGDFDGAFKNPRTRAGYWWKTGIINIMPKILMFLGLSGYFGKKIKDNYEKQTEFDKTNYTTIPLGETLDGQAIYLIIPQDEVGRMMGGIFWKGINTDKDILKSLGEISSITAGQIPSLSPAAEILFNNMQYLSGQNPYDFFRGRQILTKDEQIARGWYGLKKMGMWNMGKLGLSSSWAYTTKNKEATIVKIIRNTPIISRFIKITDYGKQEIRRERKEPKLIRQAEKRLRKKERRSQSVFSRLSEYLSSKISK